MDIIASKKKSLETHVKSLEPRREKSRNSLSPNTGKQQLLGKKIFMHYEKNHKSNSQLETMLRRLKATLVDFFDRDIHYIITNRPAHLLPPSGSGSPGGFECSSSFSPAPSPLSHPGTPVPSSPHSLNHAGNDQDLNQSLFPTPPSGGQSPSVRSTSSQDNDSSLPTCKRDSECYRGKALLLAAASKAKIEKSTPLKAIDNVNQPALSRGQRMLANLIGRKSANEHSPASPSTSTNPLQKSTRTVKPVSLQSNDILVKARNLGIRIVTTEAVMKWINNLPPDILHYVKNSYDDNDDDIKEDPKQDKLSGVRRLAAPCLKVIDLTGEYRPIFKERVEYDPLLWSESNNGGVKKRKFDNSHQKCSESQHVIEASKKTKKQELSGFCECCLKTFHCLAKHLTMSCHKEFASNADNFRYIDDVIKQMPTFQEITSRKMDISDSRKTKKVTSVSKTSKPASLDRKDEETQQILKERDGPISNIQKTHVDFTVGCENFNYDEDITDKKSNLPHLSGVDDTKASACLPQHNQKEAVPEKFAQTSLKTHNSPIIVDPSSMNKLNHNELSMVATKELDAKADEIHDYSETVPNYSYADECFERILANMANMTKTISKHPNSSETPNYSPLIAYHYPNYQPVANSTPCQVDKHNFFSETSDQLTRSSVSLIKLPAKPRKVDLDADSSSDNEPEPPCPVILNDSLVVPPNLLFQSHKFDSTTNCNLNIQSLDNGLLPRFSDEDDDNPGYHNSLADFSHLVNDVIVKLSDVNEVGEQLFSTSSIKASEKGRSSKSKTANSEIEVRFKNCPHCSKMHLPAEFDTSQFFICEFKVNTTLLNFPDCASVPNCSFNDNAPIVSNTSEVDSQIHPEIDTVNIIQPDYSSIDPSNRETCSEIVNHVINPNMQSLETENIVRECRSSKESDSFSKLACANNCVRENISSDLCTPLVAYSDSDSEVLEKLSGMSKDISNRIEISNGSGASKYSNKIQNLEVNCDRVANCESESDELTNLSGLSPTFPHLTPKNNCQSNDDRFSLTPKRRAKSRANALISDWYQRSTNHSEIYEQPTRKLKKLNKSKYKVPKTKFPISPHSQSSETDFCTDEIAASRLIMRSVDVSTDACVHDDSLQHANDLFSPPNKIPPKFSLIKRKEKVINDSSTDECSITPQEMLESRKKIRGKRKLPTTEISSSRKCYISHDSCKDFVNEESQSSPLHRVNFGPKVSGHLDVIASPRSSRRAAQEAKTGIKIMLDLIDNPLHHLNFKGFGPKVSDHLDVIASPRSSRRAAQEARTGIKIYNAWLSRQFSS